MSTEEVIKTPPMSDAELKKLGESMSIDVLDLQELEEYIEKFREQTESYTILETRYLVIGEESIAKNYREAYEKSRKTLASLIQYQAWRIENHVPKIGYQVGDLIIVTRSGRFRPAGYKLPMSSHGASPGDVYRVTELTSNVYASKYYYDEKAKKVEKKHYWFYKHEIAAFEYAKGDIVTMINWKKEVNSAYKNGDEAVLTGILSRNFKGLGHVWETTKGYGHNIAEDEFLLKNRGGMTAKEYAESLLEKETEAA